MKTGECRPEKKRNPSMIQLTLLQIIMVIRYFYSKDSLREPGKHPGQKHCIRQKEVRLFGSISIMETLNGTQWV